MDHISLRRRGSEEVERRSTCVFLAGWAFVWLASGLITYAVWSAWHGFGWGFILGGVAAGFGTWFGYTAPAVRRLGVWSAAWREHTLTVRDRDGRAVVEFDLSRPHRVSVNKSTKKNRVFLKLEQSGDAVRGGKKPVKRFEVAGPLKATGSDGARPGAARMDVDDLVPQLGSVVSLKEGPYLVDTEQSRAAEKFAVLLAFVDEHRGQTLPVPEVDTRLGTLRLHPDGFVLVCADTGAERRYFGDCRITVRARPFRALRVGGIVARILVAVVPPEGVQSALVFETTGPGELLKQLPSEWDLPDGAGERTLPAIVDIPDAAPLAAALRRYIETRDPSNPVLRALRTEDV